MKNLNIVDWQSQWKSPSSYTRIAADFADGDSCTRRVSAALEMLYPVISPVAVVNSVDGEFGLRWNWLAINLVMVSPKFI